jgi:hypothetical protein
MDRIDFQKISKMRIREGRVLLRTNHFNGAYYLLGYAIECAIKACIARQTKRYEFPNKNRMKDCYNHNLETLIKAAGLSLSLATELKNNSAFQVNWSVVKDWSEEFRYEHTIANLKAKDLYSAITDRKNGVLQWLKKYW